MGKKRKEPKIKGKKPKKEGRPSKKWELYKAEKHEFCPRCGPGVFMAKHKDRMSCGKCGYAIFSEKK